MCNGFMSQAAFFEARRDTTEREATKQDARKKCVHTNLTKNKTSQPQRLNMLSPPSRPKCMSSQLARDVLLPINDQRSTINDRRFSMLARRCRGFSDLSYSLDVGPIKPSLNRRGMNSIARGRSRDGMQATMRESNQSRIRRGRILSPARRTSVPSHRKCWLAQKRDARDGSSVAHSSRRIAQAMLLGMRPYSGP
jgi:hypothetical protein